MPRQKRTTDDKAMLRPALHSHDTTLTSFGRINLQRSSARLRQIISSTEFTELFGEAKPHPQGQRRNVFGGEDELKVAPKGVDKHHPFVLFCTVQVDFRLSLEQRHRSAQMQIVRRRSQVKRKVPKQQTLSDPLIMLNRIPDKAVLSPDFIEKLKELVVVMRPFVHWFVALPLSRTWKTSLISLPGSLNDMMTIQDPDEDSSEGDGDEGEDEGI